MSEFIKAMELLKEAFPKSFINKNNEFIAHCSTRTNEYFRLEDCETPLDLKCKVLEWFSRSAYKTVSYNQKWKNKEFHNYMMNGINTFLNTNFSEDDIDIIYTRLGNKCNRPLCICFINSNYDINILK